MSLHIFSTSLPSYLSQPDHSSIADSQRPILPPFSSSTVSSSTISASPLDRRVANEEKIPHQQHAPVGDLGRKNSSLPSVVALSVSTNNLDSSSPLSRCVERKTSSLNPAVTDLAKEKLPFLPSAHSSSATTKTSPRVLVGGTHVGVGSRKEGYP